MNGQQPNPNSRERRESPSVSCRVVLFVGPGSYGPAISRQEPNTARSSSVRQMLCRAGRQLRQLRQLHTLPEHPHKGTVAALLHQRPFQRVELPSMVSSITLMPSRWQATLRGCDHALYSAEGNPTPLHIRASAPEQYEVSGAASNQDLAHLQTARHALARHL